MKKILFLIIILMTAISVNAQKYTGNKIEIDKILKNIHDFSIYYVKAQYDSIANVYTNDAKIMPNNTEIIKGREAIKKLWTMPENVEVLAHNIAPEEITIIGNTAYDYGYYTGKIKNAEGKETSFKGKYVIVWKKINDNWKIYLDIWNRVNQ